eukprot:gene6060-8343_t
MSMSILIPCRCLKISCIHCCASSYHCIKVCCGRTCRCVSPKRPTWNKQFEISINLARNLSFTLEPHPDYVHITRMFIDNDPTFLVPFIRAKGMKIKSGKHLGNDKALPPYEVVFGKQDGVPDFDNFQNDPRKVVLYLHGGAFCVGTPALYRILLCKLAQVTGAVILAVNYRRAPEHPYPIPGDDCFAAYQWLIGKVDAKQVIVAGDSAGGALAIEVMIRARESGTTIPRGAILFSPWVDIEQDESSSMSENVCFDFIPPKLIKFCGSLYLTTHSSSDVSVTHMLLHGLPPLYVEIGEAEVLKDQIVEFVDKVRKSEVYVECSRYEDMTHVFQFLFLTGIEACKISMDRVKSFIDRLDQIHDAINQSSDISSTFGSTIVISPSNYSNLLTPNILKNESIPPSLTESNDNKI